MISINLYFRLFTTSIGGNDCQKKSLLFMVKFEKLLSLQRGEKQQHYLVENVCTMLLICVYQKIKYLNSDFGKISTKVKFSKIPLQCYRYF